MRGGVKTCNAEQTKTNNEQARDRAAFDGDIKSFFHPLFGRFCRAHIGADRDRHADKTSQTGEHGTDQKTERGVHPNQDPQADKNHRADHGDRAILAC